MGLHYLTLICIICSIMYYVYCKNDPQQKRVVGQAQGGAGVKIRLTQKAFDYFNKVLDDVLQDTLPNAPLPNVDQAFVGGTVSLTNLHITDYKRPDSYTTELQPPNKIKWSMQHMNIGIKGKLDINYAFQKGTGDFTGQAIDLSVTQQLVLARENNILNIKPVDCKAILKTLNVDITTNNTGIKAAFDFNKPTITAMVKTQLQQQLCNQFKQILSKDLNNQLKKAGSQIQLSASLKASNSNSSNSVVQANKIPPEVDDLLKQLFLDYGLVRDPVVDKRYVDVFSKGEISYMGKGGTPFNPTPLDDTGFVDKMISVLISDYVANSLFYHAFQHKLLRFKINADNYPSAAPFLSLGPCGQDECLGSLLPSLRSAYPNAKMEIQTEPTEVPKITISTDNANILLKGIFTLLGTKSGQSAQTELVKAELNTETDLNLFVDDNALKGKINIKNLSLKLISNANLKDVDQAKLDIWSQKSKVALSSVLGLILDIGLPIPLTRHGKLIQPKLSFNNRFLQLDTDVEVNKTSLEEQIKQRMVQPASVIKLIALE